MTELHSLCSTINMTDTTADTVSTSHSNVWKWACKDKTDVENQLQMEKIQGYVSCTFNH